jgi:monofunctional glycosyltransferase
MRLPGGHIPKPGRSKGLRIWIRRIAIAVLAGPLVFVLAYRFLPPLLTPLMLIRSVEGYAWHHQWVNYSHIAPALGEAVVASEDNLFCEEKLGFDFGALRSQIEAWSAGERPRGASTITTQTAKNLLLWPGRDIIRKLVEVWLTPQFALLWPKQRVLEVYLNIVEFGPGVYGVQAAARYFFHKSAADLSIHEAALLASVLPAPLTWSASMPNRHVQSRAFVIEQRMEQIRPLLACLR